MPLLSKRPESHFVQNVWPPRGCTEPPGHFEQLPLSLAVEIVCGAHASHVAAVALINVPGVHELQ
jgi:hypothetical protein